MRCACIDIGANTTRLLVAEPAGGGGLREVAARRAFSHLGAGRAGRTAAEPEREALTAILGLVVAQQADEARALGAAHLRVVATAALRDAPDREAVLAALRDAAPGAAVDVLTTEEEARLAFLGATALLRDPPPGVLGVIDVGGGSTELAVGERGRPPAWSISLPLGSATLTDAHLRGDPPGEEELAAARETIAAAMARAGVVTSAGVVGRGVAPFPRPVAAAYAVGGSASSVRRLAGPALGAGALAAALVALTAGPAAQVAARHALHPRRVALLPAGILLLEAASEVLGAAPRSCRGGLREGVVLTELARVGGLGHGQGT
jgi:exopolyphosphatase/guanosine-5'-triphosphate,3'-diphosphate pyrophosphatase